MYDTKEEISSPDSLYEHRIQRIIGRKMIGKRCYQDHIRNDDGSVQIFLTEKQVDASTLWDVNWVEVLMVGENCQKLTKAQFDKWVANHHVLMVFPEWGDGVDEIADDLWWVDERLMEGKNPEFRPFVALLPRSNTEEST